MPGTLEGRGWRHPREIGTNGLRQCLEDEWRDGKERQTLEADKVWEEGQWPVENN